MFLINNPTKNPKIKGYLTFYVPSLKDPNLRPSDPGYLARCISYLTNPKNKDNLFLNKFLVMADKPSQFDRLLYTGYITEYMIPTGTKNSFSWIFKIDSNPRQDDFYRYNLKSDNQTIKSRFSIKELKGINYLPAPLPSDRFVKIPNEILFSDIDNLSLSLYIHLLSFKNRSNYSKTKLIEMSGMSEKYFNRAWATLKKYGFLNVINKATQHGKMYDFIINKIPCFPSEIHLNGKGEIIEKTIFFGNSQGDTNLKDAKIDDNITRFIASKYSSLGISISSKEQTFDEETKSVLNKIKKSYSNESNSELIDTLNQKLSNLYKSKHIDLKNVVITYRNVLVKYHYSGYENILSMSAYCNKIVNNDFIFKEISHYLTQDYSGIEELLKKPLNFNNKTNNSSNSFTNFEKNHSNYDFEEIERELMSLKSSEREEKLSSYYYVIDYDFDVTGLDYYDKLQLNALKNGSGNYKKNCYKAMIDKLLIYNPNALELFEEQQKKKDYYYNWLINKGA